MGDVGYCKMTFVVAKFEHFCTKKKPFQRAAENKPVNHVINKHTCYYPLEKSMDKHMMTGLGKYILMKLILLTTETTSESTNEFNTS